MRLIDADVLIKQCKPRGIANEVWKESNEYKQIINAPTIDAIPVVRCGECKYWKEGKCWNMKGLNKTDGIVNADDFCSYGEREDGEA